MNIVNSSSFVYQQFIKYFSPFTDHHRQIMISLEFTFIILDTQIVKMFLCIVSFFSSVICLFISVYIRVCACVVYSVLTDLHLYILVCICILQCNNRFISVYIFVCICSLQCNNRFILVVTVLFLSKLYILSVWDYGKISSRSKLTH